MIDVDFEFHDTIGECSFTKYESIFAGEPFTLDCPRDEAAGQAGFTVTLKLQPAE